MGVTEEARRRLEGDPEEALEGLTDVQRLLFEMDQHTYRAERELEQLRRKANELEQLLAEGQDEARE